jgi:hypothetical protein
MSDAQQSEGMPEHNGAEGRQVPPWMRPAEPDHPMMVEGDVIDGDTALMFRCLIEEYLLGGHSPEDIRAMFGQPNFQAFHAAAQTLGQEQAERILTETASRIGRHRVRFLESKNTSKEVTLTIGASTSIPAD